MPFYSDAETYYQTMRSLFDCVQANYPKATESIGNARINIQMRTTGPAADILIMGRERPVAIRYDLNGVKPDLVIEMAADTFHKILLGELSLKSALGGGQMKVKGPIFKAMSLGDLFYVSRQCYPNILKQRAEGNGQPE